MADRLRDLIDLIIDSLDERDADGAALARRAHFSRDHLDRLLAAATGESPVALRRRLLLERAAWQLRTGAKTPAEAATEAGYGSTAAFSRAFSRTFDAPPTRYHGPPHAQAPNGIHFHPPAGILIEGAPSRNDVLDRMVAHHLDRVRELLEAADTVTDLDVETHPGLTVTFEGPEPTPKLMAERLVFTLEVWAAAIDGQPFPDDTGPLRPRFEHAAREFARLARRISERGAYDDAFVDALCEPPQSFTYGGVLAHVLTFGAIRREALAAALTQLGADVPDTADPIIWESQRTRTRMLRNQTTS